MTDEDIMKMYVDIGKILNDKKLDHALIAIGVVIADLAYRTESSVLQVLALVNKVAVVNHQNMEEEENESTKH